MNTEYAVGNIRIHFESRARRRWLVALFYAVVAGFDFAPFSTHSNTLNVWMVSGYGVLFAAVTIVFTWIAGDPNRGDEREMHRRDHAHFLAYRILLYGFLAASVYYFGAIPAARSLLESNPSSLFLRGVLSGSLREHFLFIAAVLLFGFLPQAILLWTEPDMEKAR
jgi:phosphatidylserine synthase